MLMFVLVQELFVITTLPTPPRTVTGTSTATAHPHVLHKTLQVNPAMGTLVLMTTHATILVFAQFLQVFLFLAWHASQVSASARTFTFPEMCHVPQMAYAQGTQQERRVAVQLSV